MKVQTFWDDTCLTLRKEIGSKIPVDPMMLYLGVIKGYIKDICMRGWVSCKGPKETPFHKSGRNGLHSCVMFCVFHSTSVLVRYYRLVICNGFNVQCKTTNDSRKMQKGLVS